MASYAESLPHLPSTSPADQQKTNSISVTGVPKSFFDPQILNVLHDHFATYGSMNQWVPLAGFGRIIIVYYQEADAEAAKQQSDPIIVQANQDRSEVALRVYRADPNPIIERTSDSTVPEANLLRPPKLDKNFLISPPGSPPVGWEPIVEDPPNATPLADDLIAALKRLQTSSNGSNREVLLDPHEGSGVGVYVQNCDGEDEEEVPEEDWVYGETAPARTKWIVPTAMPPPIRAPIVA